MGSGEQGWYPPGIAHRHHHRVPWGHPTAPPTGTSPAPWGVPWGGKPELGVARGPPPPRSWALWHPSPLSSQPRAGASPPLLPVPRLHPWERGDGTPKSPLPEPPPWCQEGLMQSSVSGPWSLLPVLSFPIPQRWPERGSLGCPGTRRWWSVATGAGEPPGEQNLLARGSFTCCVLPRVPSRGQAPLRPHSGDLGLEQALGAGLLLASSPASPDCDLAPAGCKGPGEMRGGAGWVRCGAGFPPALLALGEKSLPPAPWGRRSWVRAPPR